MVSLSLFQNPLVRKEIIANYYTSAYSLPFGKKLAAAFSSGWEYFLKLSLVHLSPLGVYAGRIRFLGLL